MEKPEEVLDRYKANWLYRNEKGLLFAESDRGTQLICSQLCPSIGYGESYHGYEPKSITRPELPEPETVTYGGYVEVTELLALPDEVLIPFLTDIQELCKRLNSYNHFANRFLKEE